MRIVAQVGHFLSTRRMRPKLSTFFRKPCRNYSHTNHSRHKLKSVFSALTALRNPSHLYYRLGLVLSILVVSVISEEESSVFDHPYYVYTSNVSSHSLSRHTRSSRAGLTRKLSNGDPMTIDQHLGNVSNGHVMDERGKMGCVRCMSHEGRVNYTLNALKVEILEKLGLKHPPNITPGVKLPNIPPLTTFLDQARGNAHTQGMLDDQPLTFKAGSDGHEYDDNYWAKTKKIIFLPQYLKIRHTTFRENVLHFNFSEKVVKNDIESANLYFWMRGLEEDEEDLPVQISFHTVSRNPSGGDNLILISSYTEKKRRSKSGEYFSIDISDLVAQWFRSPRSNLGLVIRATPISMKEIHVEKPLVSTEILDQEHTPYLEVFTKEKERHRKRRDVGATCNEKSTEVNCCRYPLTVDFDSFGWTFVIAPKRYEAYYCSGECPFVYLPTNPHTHVTQFAQPKHGPCCAAKKLSPLTMLYFDDMQSIILGILPGMVVDRCGCT